MTKFKFEATHVDWSEIEGLKTTMEFSGVSLTDVLENFKLFLASVGYYIKPEHALQLIDESEELPSIDDIFEEVEDDEEGNWGDGELSDDDFPSV